MTRRNKWLKKQRRKIQGIRGYVPKRIRAARKAYAIKFAKYIHDSQIHSIPFPSLVEQLRNYASGKQNIAEYKAKLGL